MGSRLHSRTKKAISPDFEPQSPSPSSMLPVKLKTLEDDSEPEDLRSTPSEYDRKDSANRAISPKRKRDSFEEVASSSPLKPDTTTTDKRTRYEKIGE